MPSNRPDLTGLPIEILSYIQTLENELEELRSASAQRTARAAAEPRMRAESRGFAAIVDEEIAGPSEPPSGANLVTATAGGIIKRTPRHLYGRQNRGGMGVFDLDAPEGDPPAFLAVADISQSLILVSTLGRAYPVSVSQLQESPVRGRGESVRRWAPLSSDERIALLTPDVGSGHLTMVTRRGQVRRWRYNVFGRALQPGTILYDIRDGGAPASCFWSAADSDLFILTAQGMAIRFSETQVAVRGSLGIRIDPGDAVVGAVSVKAEEGVFLLSEDGKGTVRQMAGFSANKAPGSGGKQAMKADRLVGAAVARPGDDLFVISGLGKIIRFAVDETPAKDGVVQGVNCMALRNDQCTAIVSAGLWLETIPPARRIVW